MHVKKSTACVMIYGELGRHPLSIIIKKRIVAFWCKLVNGNMNRFSSSLYRILLDDVQTHNFRYDWISFVKAIFDDTGLSYIWFEHNAENSSWLSKTVQNILESQYKQAWQDSLEQSSKCSNYKIYKTKHKFEKYLILLPPRLLQKLICFRLCNNRLPIETGRWRGTDHNLRKCNLCYLNLVGDEFHYLLECPFFSDERKTFLPIINRRNLNCITL